MASFSKKQIAVLSIATLSFAAIVSVGFKAGMLKFSADESTAINNPGFENAIDHLSGWKQVDKIDTTQSATSSDKISAVSGVECVIVANNCAKLQPSAATTEQYIETKSPTNLEFKSYYKLTVRFKTSSKHQAALYYLDQVQPAYHDSTLLFGDDSNKWQELSTYIRTPDGPSSGRIGNTDPYIFRMASVSNTLTINDHNSDPVWFDDITLTKLVDPAQFNPHAFINSPDGLGCSNSLGDSTARDSRCLNFNLSSYSEALDESGSRTPMLISSKATPVINTKDSTKNEATTDDAVIKSTQTAKSIIPIAIENNVAYGSLVKDQTAFVQIPAFNVNADGTLKSPMLLEVKYKDEVSSRSGSLPKINSYLNYPSDLTNAQGNTLIHPSIMALGDLGDNNWKIAQYAFQASQFQMINFSTITVNGVTSNYFTFEIPTLTASSLKINYINLRAISAAQYANYFSNEKKMLGFQMVLPKDSNPPAGGYTSDLSVFTRDIMQPIFKTTAPSQAEIDSATSGITVNSAPGEVEPVSVGLYSKDGITTRISSAKVTLQSVDNPNQVFSGTVDVMHVGYRDVQIVSNYANSPRLDQYYPDYLEPMPSTLVVSPNTSERIWFRIHIPSGVSGRYQGMINVQGTTLSPKNNVLVQNGSVNANIPVTLNLLNQSLDSSLTYDYVYQDINSRVQSYDSSSVTSLFKDDKLTPRINSLKLDNIKTLPSLTADNLKTFSGNLLRMKSEGVLKNGDSVIVDTTSAWNQIWSNMFPNSAYNTASNSTLISNFENTQFVSTYASLLRNLDNISKSIDPSDASWQVKFIYSAIDEPGMNGDRGRITAAELYKQIKAQNLTTTTTYHSNDDKSLTVVLDDKSTKVIDPITSLVDWKVWAPFYHIQDGYNDSASAGKGINDCPVSRNFSFYLTGYSQLRNPIYDRFYHGIFAARTCTQSISDYSLGSITNDPFDDFDTSPGKDFPVAKSDLILGYPTWPKDARYSGKYLPTMATEGIREGIKDSEYIATLQRLIQAKSAPEGTAATTDTQKKAKEAKEYLDSFNSKVSPMLNDGYALDSEGQYHSILKSLSETGKTSDYASFTIMRDKIWNYINLLSSTSN